MLNKMKGLPWQPVPERAGTRIPTWINGDRDGVQESHVDKETAVSEEVSYEDEAIPIKPIPPYEVPPPPQADVEDESEKYGNASRWKLRKFGLTMTGCKACINLHRYGQSRCGHSDACRRRLAEKVKQDTEERES